MVWLTFVFTATCWPITWAASPVSLTRADCHRIELMWWNYCGVFPRAILSFALERYCFSLILLHPRHGEQFVPCDYEYIRVCAVTMLSQLSGLRSSSHFPVRPDRVYFPRMVDGWSHINCGSTTKILCSWSGPNEYSFNWNIWTKSIRISKWHNYLYLTSFIKKKHLCTQYIRSIIKASSSVRSVKNI